ncbi:MAG: molecular chaperone DnaK [Thermoplasmata archaeon]|nr:molecular chaperone DnaK [Thermoplasmata archaeon]
MSKIIGIDLGTTNSEAAYLEAGRPKIIPSAEGNTYGGKNFPSVVAFTKDGERLVGEAAKRQAVLNPERTISRIKREMGSDFKVTIDDNSYSPQEISAMILQKIKHDAEQFLGEDVKQVVITVPAYYNDSQRQATKDAGKIAGLKVLRIINEPTAAALAYGLEKSESQKIIVLDLGGGTFDVTIMETGDGVFEVISTSGDTKLGGSDMDDTIMKYLIEDFKAKEGIDVSNDKAVMQRLRDAAERGKMELSSQSSTTISLPFLYSDNGGPKHLEVTLNRAKLDDLVMPVVKRCEKPIRDAIKDAKMDFKEIDKVMLVGGPTRMPVVRQFFEKIIGKSAESGVDPMQCVAMGASIQAGVLAGEVEDIVLLDVTPLSLGVETLGSVSTKLIERNTTIPTRKSQIFSTAADNQTSVEINILQGEREMASDNVSLGRFHLVGIPPSPRGIPQIEVAFDIDANGIVNVSAKDLGTGKEQKITITATTNLSDEEVERKVQDAEKYAEEDKKKREEIDIMNQADSMVYSTERTLEELKDKISDEQKSQIEEKLDDLKKAIEIKEVEHIKSSLDSLGKILHEVTTAMYQQVAQEQQAQQQTQEGAGDPEPAGEGEYVDADFEEVE